jgi:hypothetical protein
VTAFALAAAVGAAFCYAVGATLEQQQVRRTSSRRLVHPEVLWQVIRRPLWLAGFAVGTFGVALHGFALGRAPLAIVQPLGVTTVLFAVPLAALVHRRRPSAGTLVAAAVTVAALAGLLSTLQIPAQQPVLTGTGLLTLATVVGSLLALTVGMARLVHGTARTVLLACGAGAAMAVTSALGRVLIHQAATWGLPGLLGPPSLAIVGSAAAGVLLEQGAYKSGHLPAAVAVMTVVDPLVATVAGAAVLNQPVHIGHPLLTAGLAAAVVAGVAMLSRRRARIDADPAAAEAPAESHRVLATTGGRS